jgi:adenylosuccinate synthase
VREILRVNLAEKKPLLDSYGITPISESEILNWIRHYGKLLKPFVIDTSKLIRDGLASGKRVLFEGAQGALLDIDFGTYPYVTSSQTGVWGIASGAGVLPKQIGRVYGVLKAYTTRVGEGPLPTEERGKIGERLRSAGGEYGATTHRPRRCGWLDLVSVKYAAILNGVDGLIVTKLDVLTGISPLKVAISYRIGNKTTNEFPVSTTDLERVKPVYKDMAGWNEPITKIRQFADLPKAASEYLRFIEEYLKVPIVMVSVGTEREAIIKIKAKRK